MSLAQDLMRFPQTLAGLEPSRLAAVLPADDAPVVEGQDLAYRQSRAGEEDRGQSAMEELRALYTSPGFWELAALLPHNTLASLRPAFGRPQDFPDWFLFLLHMAANTTGTRSRRAVIKLIRNKREWTALVNDVDRFVPEGWAQLRHLVHDDAKHARRARARVKAALPKDSNVIPMKPLRNTSMQRTEQLAIAPPADHHLDYFKLHWDGYKKSHGKKVPLRPGDPYYQVRERMLAAFPAIAVDQAMRMGLLNPNRPFQYKKPDRSQVIGCDGTVFRIGKYKKPNKAAGIETHTIGGGGQVCGSKFTIMSTRVPGQPNSHLILDFGQTGHASESRFATESEGMTEMALRIRDLTKGGARILVADSAMRGNAVVNLQAAGITVVNYPHAKSNPGGGPGKRLGPLRVEKSYLRHVARHTDANGLECLHPIYAVGGHLVERLIDADGAINVRALDYEDYEQRWKRDFDAEAGAKVGKRREYLIVRIPCGLAGDFNARVPLFHVDGPSTDPDLPYGEVVRVFPPGGPAHNFIYGARNDTESGNNDLKQRIRFMSADISGQQLRMLGAALVINAVAWHTHLQALGLPNVLDDTA